MKVIVYWKPANWFIVDGLLKTRYEAVERVERLQDGERVVIEKNSGWVAWAEYAGVRLGMPPVRMASGANRDGILRKVANDVLEVLKADGHAPEDDFEIKQANL